MYLTTEKVCGEVNASPSKSHLLRLLFLSYMANGDSFVVLPDNEICSDAEDAMRCAGIFGKKCVLSENVIKITPEEAKSECHVEGSATALRFLLACGSVKGANFKVTVGKTLLSRPHSELISALNANGAAITQSEDGFEVNGKAKSGLFAVSAEKSSQYVSALCLSLPFADGDSVIETSGKTASSPYIELTLSVLCGAGIGINRKDGAFFIKGSSAIKGVNGVCEGDWSSAAVFLCMGAVCGSVKVNGVSLSSKQGDKRICDILKASGASIEENENGVTVTKGENRSFCADITDIPDLAPVLAAYAAFCDGKSVISNVTRLRYKESDREKFIINSLRSVGCRVESENDSIIIEKGTFVQTYIDCGNDHRNAFLLGILSAMGRIGVSGEDCVKKSCPSFFEKFVKIGGNIQ